jgi:hypothetical protein
MNRSKLIWRLALLLPLLTMAMQLDSCTEAVRRAFGGEAYDQTQTAEALRAAITLSARETATAAAQQTATAAPQQTATFAAAQTADARIQAMLQTAVAAATATAQAAAQATAQAQQVWQGVCGKGLPSTADLEEIFKHPYLQQDGVRLYADEVYFKCHTEYTSVITTTVGMASVFDVSMTTAAETEGATVIWSIYGKPAPFRPGDYAMELGGPWNGGIVVGDAPTIGQASIVIEGPYPRIGQQAQAAFIKGNVVVVILIQGTGEDVAAENAIKLAQVSADRIPDISPMPEPTLFPDKLDQTAGASIFKSIEIGKMEGDQFVPAATFSWLVVNVVSAAPGPLPIARACSAQWRIPRGHERPARLVNAAQRSTPHQPIRTGRLGTCPAKSIE